MHMSPASPSIRTPGQPGDNHCSLRSWLNFSRATVNKDHKILYSPLNFLWSLNKMSTGAEKPNHPLVSPQHPPGVLPQGKPITCAWLPRAVSSLPATEALKRLPYSIKPRLCLCFVSRRTWYVMNYSPPLSSEQSKRSIENNKSWKVSYLNEPWTLSRRSTLIHKG